MPTVVLTGLRGWQVQRFRIPLPVPALESGCPPPTASGVSSLQCVSASRGDSPFTRAWLSFHMSSIYCDSGWTYDNLGMGNWTVTVTSNDTLVAAVTLFQYTILDDTASSGSAQPIQSTRDAKSTSTSMISITGASSTLPATTTSPGSGSLSSTGLSQKSGISSGAIAGIVVGCLVLLAAVLGGIWWWRHRRSRAGVVNAPLSQAGLKGPPSIVGANKIPTGANAGPVLASASGPLTQAPMTAPAAAPYAGGTTSHNP